MGNKVSKWKKSDKDPKRCGSCSCPEMACPATLRRFIRCCSGCTHRTDVDADYERAHPGFRGYFGQPPHPTPERRRRGYR